MPTVIINNSYANASAANAVQAKIANGSNTGLAGVTVKFSGPAAVSFPNGNTCVTNAGGTCNVNVVSTTAGTFAITTSTGAVTNSCVNTSVNTTFVTSPPPTVTSTKTASANPMWSDISGQYYTVNVTVGGGATTAPILLADTLPTNMTLTGAPSLIPGTSNATAASLSGCPTTGAVNTTGCSVATGISAGTFSIKIPVKFATSSPATYPPGNSMGTNTANLSGGGDASCTTAADACDSTTGSVEMANSPVIRMGAWAIGNPPTTSATFNFTMTGLTATSDSISIVGENFVWSSLGNLPGTAGVGVTYTEPTVPAGWPTNMSQPSGCSDANKGNATVSSVTTAGNVTTIPASAMVRDVSLTCSLFNARPVIYLKKAIVGTPPDSGLFNLLISGGHPNNASQLKNPATNVGNGGATSFIAIDVASTITLSESAGTSTTLSKYTASISCATAAGVAVPATVAGANWTITSPAAADMGNAKSVFCTITNTVITPKTLQLNKIWSANAVAGNAMTVATTGGSANPSVSSMATAAGNSTTGTAVTVTVGNTITLPAETFNTGLQASYTSTVSCNNSAVPVSNATPGTPAASFTVAAADTALVCTYTNTFKPPTLSLQKALGTSGRIAAADQFVLSGTGPGFAPAVTTTGSAAAITSGAYSFAATAGSAYSLTEAMASGSSSALTQYNQAVSCTNPGPTVVTSFTTLPINVTPAAGDAISCTVTNTAGSTDLSIVSSQRVMPSGSFSSSLMEAVVGEVVQYRFVVTNNGPLPANGATFNNPFTVNLTGLTVMSATPSTGAACNASVSGTTLNGTVPTLPVGGTCTVIVQATATAMSTAAGIGHMASVFVPAGMTDAISANNTSAVTIRIVGTVTLKKVVVGTPPPGDNGLFNLTFPLPPSRGPALTGATNVGDGGSTTTQRIQGNSGPSVNKITFNETATAGSNLANYNASYKCSTGVSGPLSGPNASFTVTSGNTGIAANVVCTITNTVTAPTLSLQKALGGSGRIAAADQFSLSGTGTGAPVATTTTGATTAITSAAYSFAATAGSAYSLTEAMAAGSSSTLTQYSQAVSCTNPGPTSVTGFTSLSINVTPAIGDVIMCTVTNTPSAPSVPKVQIVKTVSSGSASNVFNFALGGLSASTDSITVVGIASANGSSALTGTAGTAVTIGETSPAGWPANPVSASCVDSQTAVSGNPSGPLGTLSGNMLSIPATNLVNGAALTCSFTNVYGFSVTGRVFTDNGAGAGAANDGVLNGAEAGRAGVGVKLTDCAATTLATATTDASGSYSLSVPFNTAVGAPLCVEETNLASSVSTGASVGSTAVPSGSSVAVGGTNYLYSRTGPPERIAFAWNGSGHAGLNFGDVGLNTFAADGAKSGQPGNTVSYAHTFTAQTGGSVSFGIASAVASPVISGWGETVYADPGCTGALQPGAALLYPPAAAVTVVAGQALCVIVEEFIPATALEGYKNTVTVQANFSFTNAAPALAASYTAVDTTSVGSGALDLKKEVRNVTQSGAFGINNQAKSGETLEYRITYTNNGASPISGLSVSDVTPNYTTFISATDAATPASVSSCHKQTPANPAPAATVLCVTAQTPGGTGAVSLRFIGPVNPGASGSVLFQVKVD